MNLRLLFYTLVLIIGFSSASPQYKIEPGCFEKWLTGYRLAAGRPQRTFTSVTLERCQSECERERGCGAIAYGVTGAANGTCELAIRTLRDSRSVNNLTLPYDEITKAHQYDIYMMSPTCMQRQPLFSSGSSALAPIVGNGVPIDCFYRLMSGKRLAKNNVFRAISVAGLQECQEACIDDGNCRSISYRYMVSATYSYNVANCELSPFYIVNYDDTSRTKYDFVDDYDYDYFQREPHCKTTSRLGSFGVCAVVARKGTKLHQNLIKSTHQTSTATQCEFLCQTASRFRCRAFSLRHTTRGRDPFHRDSNYESVCNLYDVDISRLSSYEMIQDPDYDLYELGRLMGAECVLYDQYLNRRPVPPTGLTHYYDKDRDYHRRPDQRYPYQQHDRDFSSRERPGGPYLPTRRPYDYDYHSKRPGNYFYPEQKIDSGFPRPGLSSEISGSVTHGIGTSSFVRPTSSPNLPYYDPRREACLVKIKQDVYLAPEATRATFPAKNEQECRIECLRSLEVLRFPCRVMSYRLTSSSGGSCQISEYYEQDLRPGDFIPARDRYENAVTYSYDETDVLCKREETRYAGGGSHDRATGHLTPEGLYIPDRGTRYGTSDRYPVVDRRDHRYGTTDRYPVRDNRYGTGYGTSTVIGQYGRQPFIDYRPTRYPNYDTRDTDRDRYGSIYGKGNTHIDYDPSAKRDGNGVQTYTVNGEKCLRQCSQDREAGFYYCVVDTRGTWDFCCRPDHYCGYSRGLSTPWCYVGSGPTSQVWRSCNHRLLSESPNPPIAYLHDRPPPKVHSLSTSEVANLSKDNALKLLKSTSENQSEFANLDEDDVATTLHKNDNEIDKASSNVNGTEVFYGSKLISGKNETIKIVSRQSRRISRKPTFTVVEVKGTIKKE